MDEPIETEWGAGPRPKRIGDLNGPWAVLMKVSLAVMPFVVGFTGWLVVNQVLDNDFRNRGERWTQSDANVQARALVTELTLYVEKRMAMHEGIAGHAVMEQRMKTAVDRIRKLEER